MSPAKWHPPPRWESLPPTEFFSADKGQPGGRPEPPSVSEADLPRYAEAAKADEPKKPTTPSVTPGVWKSDRTGWWFQNPDGSYPANAWKLINGLWYFFNGAGYMESSKWVESSGKWYYVGANGDMLTNTTTPDGYRVGADGAWIK